MGRTNPTYRDALARLEAKWEPMRRGLRREYQGDFDRLFARARGFADAAGNANPYDPERALVLSLLLAHEVEIRALEDRLEECEAALKGDADERGDANPEAGESEAEDEDENGEEER